MMSRKDYEVIADVLATTSDREAIARALATRFEDANPRFDREKFLDAARAKEVGR